MQLQLSSKSRLTVYCGFFFIGLATLLFEITLTRVFSVVLWYHFAFVVVSLALFGFAASGMWVYLRPDVFSPERTWYHAWRSALTASLLFFVVNLVFAHFPFSISANWFGLGLISLISLLTAAPFFYAGLAISVVLTHFTRSVCKLYFADLLGAGLGCLVVVPGLNWTSGPSVLLYASAAAAAAGIFFALELDGDVYDRVVLTGKRWLKRGLFFYAVAALMLILAISLGNGPAVRIAAKIYDSMSLGSVYGRPQPFSFFLPFVSGFYDSLGGALKGFLWPSMAAAALFFLLSNWARPARLNRWIAAHGCVLCSSLLFAGLGSYATGRWEGARLARNLIWVIALLVILVLGHLTFVPPVLESLMGLPQWVRLVLAVAMIAPIGFFLGMLFPGGIRLMGQNELALVPWIWGINGATSALGSVLALLIAVTFGFSRVLLLSILVYALAGMILVRRFSSSDGERI